MRPTFDSLATACIADELQLLVGGQIQRISQPDALQIVFAVYSVQSGEKHLLIDVSPRYFRAHLTTQKTTKLASPPPFCMTLRKYIGDGKIVSVAQRNGDRILDFYIEKSGENNGEKFLLSAELMGKHANLILVSGENKILHAAKLITTRQSRLREVLPNKEYSPPPAPRFENQYFESPYLDLPHLDLPQWQPVIVRDESENLSGAYPIPIVGLRCEPRPSFSVALDEYFGFIVPRAKLTEQQSTLRGAISKTLSQKNRALTQVQRGASESGKAEQYRRWGELILGNLHAVKTQMASGASQAEVLDFYDPNGANVSIPLDENLSPQENANHYFSRARHVEENAAQLKALESTLAREVTELEAFLKLIEAAPDVLELRQLNDQAQTRGWLRLVQQSQSETSTSATKPALDFGGHKIKKFISPDGFNVLVGENATANDFLVTRLSHSNDWWMHLRGGTSSHAIIQTHNAPDRVPLSTLLFAARLVIARSVAKHAGWAEVDYTLKKYVRKPRKAAPGAVVHSNAKTLHVEPEK